LQRGCFPRRRTARCARSSRVVLIPRRWYHACDDASRVAQVTVAKKPGAPGRTRSSRSNHCAGNAGMSRLNLWYLPPAFFSQAGHGGGQLPAFPAPSVFKRAVHQHNSDATCAARRRHRVQLSAEVMPPISAIDLKDPWVQRHHSHAGPNRPSLSSACRTRDPIQIRS
jgi:hypothetical protein